MLTAARTHSQNEYAPFFETVIRYLGGLLSAYALSGEPILLTRADDLGKLLMPAFEGRVFPAYSVNTVTCVSSSLVSVYYLMCSFYFICTRGKTGMGWTGSMVLFAEAASCQLEFKYLAKLTGRREYYDAVRVPTPLPFAQFPSMSKNAGRAHHGHALRRRRPGGAVPHALERLGAPAGRYVLSFPSFLPHSLRSLI